MKKPNGEYRRGKGVKGRNLTKEQLSFDTLHNRVKRLGMTAWKKGDTAGKNKHDVGGQADGIPSRGGEKLNPVKAIQLDGEIRRKKGLTPCDLLKGEES